MSDQPKVTWFRGGRFVEDAAPDWWIHAQNAMDADNLIRNYDHLLKKHAGLEPVIGTYGPSWGDDVRLFKRNSEAVFFAWVTIADRAYDVFIGSEADLLAFHHEVAMRAERQHFYFETQEALLHIKNVLIAIGRHHLGLSITDDGEAYSDVRKRLEEVRRSQGARPPAAAE